MHTLVGGRLRLVDPIGTGATGTVWRAWDLRSRRYVAAKVAQVVALPDQRPAIHHPHVLCPHEWLEAEGVTVAVMRLVRGGTADRLLADHGALPAAYVAVLLDQLLDALTAVHGAGLVHRDMKPANLLLEVSGTGRPHVWLADLGVATQVGETATIAGTDGYLAPELAPGSPASPGHDLYAAGVTAAELLTGRIPRDSRDLPRGPLRPLLRALTADAPARPATADHARAVLRRIGVPDGTPWRQRAHPPDVPDRMPRMSLLERWRVQGTRAAQ